MLHVLASNLPLVVSVVSIVIVLALVSRVPLLQRLLSILLLVGLAGLAATMLGERARFDPVLGRIADLVQPGGEEVTGSGEMRVRMSPDGHFWVRAHVNRKLTRMLVDSGATVTALSVTTAEEAGLDVRDPLVPVLLRTANGTVPARTAQVDALRFGPVVARDLAVVVSPAFGDTDVLGMNFLSRLKSWRVEDGTLVLVPHHPQATAAEAPIGWRDRLLALWPRHEGARGG